LQDLEKIIGEIQNKTIIVTVGKNIIVNGRDIIKEVEALVKAADNNDWENIGLNLGDIVRQLLLNLEFMSRQTEEVK